MLNKLLDFIRCQGLILPGDQIVCAVSGGADSVAMLFALYLLRERLSVTLSAAHYNHGLRGDESDRDELFVRQLCDHLDIPLTVGCGKVVAGKKGLEAAARDARYGFFETLPGKIATAHTADDNAETVLMHLIRGTGLKGLGGISPMNGRLIRPMLSVTRKDVLCFLQEYHLTYVTDSSNHSDCFMRNRLRHHILPLLRQENPKLSENISAMALRLREDEKLLADLSCANPMPDVPTLRQMPRALRSRCISAFLQRHGFMDSDAAHIALVDNLIFSDNPSAKFKLSENKQISRCYDKLICTTIMTPIQQVQLTCPGEFDIGAFQIRILPAEKQINGPNTFTVVPSGRMVLRCKQPGDSMRTPGGTKTLKKIFIDQKIPAFKRCSIPVIADDEGVLGVFGIGANLNRFGFDCNAIEINIVRTTDE